MFDDVENKHCPQSEQATDGYKHPVWGVGGGGFENIQGWKKDSKCPLKFFRTVHSMYVIV